MHDGLGWVSLIQKDQSWFCVSPGWNWTICRNSSSASGICLLISFWLKSLRAKWMHVFISCKGIASSVEDRSWHTRLHAVVLIVFARGKSSIMRFDATNASCKIQALVFQRSERRIRRTSARSTHLNAMHLCNGLGPRLGSCSPPARLSWKSCNEVKSF